MISDTLKHNDKLKFNSKDDVNDVVLMSLLLT